MSENYSPEFDHDYNGGPERAYGYEQASHDSGQDTTQALGHTAMQDNVQGSWD